VAEPFLAEIRLMSFNFAPKGWAVTNVGGSQPHTNFQPYLCINYIISLFGIFPSPT
jgi:microcystin-dependent protein